MKNREWLNSMSDEEFSKEVLEGNECRFCIGNDPHAMCYNSKEKCIRGHVKWLQAEHKAEGDNGDKKE